MCVWRVFIRLLSYLLTYCTCWPSFYCRLSVRQLSAVCWHSGFTCSSRPSIRPFLTKVLAGFKHGCNRLTCWLFAAKSNETILCLSSFEWSDGVDSLSIAAHWLPVVHLYFPVFGGFRKLKFVTSLVGMLFACVSWITCHCDITLYVCQNLVICLCVFQLIVSVVIVWNAVFVFWLTVHNVSSADCCSLFSVRFWELPDMSC